MSAAQDAWQAALAAEHRAFYAYALLGPRLTGTQRALAVTCYRAHQTLRDTTEAAIAAAAIVPVTTQPDYPELYPVSAATGARRLAVEVEAFCASAWRYLYAVTAGGATVPRVDPVTLRSAAQAALTASAVRGARWRQLVQPDRPFEPFPGV